MRMFGTGSETCHQDRQNIVYVYVNYPQSKGELVSSFNKQDSFFFLVEDLPEVLFYACIGFLRSKRKFCYGVRLTYVKEDIMF